MDFDACLCSIQSCYEWRRVGRRWRPSWWIWNGKRQNLWLGNKPRESFQIPKLINFARSLVHPLVLTILIKLENDPWNGFKLVESVKITPSRVVPPLPRLVGEPLLPVLYRRAPWWSMLPSFILRHRRKSIPTSFDNVVLQDIEEGEEILGIWQWSNWSVG